MTPLNDGVRIDDRMLPAQGFTDAELSDVMYQLTADPDQAALLVESCDLEEADAVLNPGVDLIAEAVSAVKNQLDRTMSAMVRVLNRYSDNVKPYDFPSIGPDRKNALFAYKTTNFTFDDGQTVSILFHSPGADPMKLKADDTLIAYRWMLNRRDITASVAPEKGRDLNLQTMAKRLMQLVEENSEKFQANNKKRQEQKEKLATLESEQKDVSQRVETLAQQNAELSGQIDTAEDRIERLQARLAEVGEAGREGAGNEGDEEKPPVRPDLTRARHKPDLAMSDIDVGDFVAAYDSDDKRLLTSGKVTKKGRTKVDVVTDYMGKPLHKKGTPVFGRGRIQVLKPDGTMLATSENDAERVNDALSDKAERENDEADTGAAATSAFDNNGRITVDSALDALMDALRNDTAIQDEARQVDEPGEFEAERLARKFYEASADGIITKPAADGPVEVGEKLRLNEKRELQGKFAEQARDFLMGVMQESGGNESDGNPADAIDTPDGWQISAGPFIDFTLVAQSALGVNSNSVNVKSTNGTTVGTIERGDVDAFTRGETDVFTPADNWQSTFSNELKQKPGLAEPEPDTSGEPGSLEALDSRLYRDIAGSIGVIRGIDNGTERGYNRSLFTSSIANKLKTQARNGNEDVVGAALLLLAQQSIEHGKPILAKRNAIWKATGRDMDYYTEIAKRQGASEEDGGDAGATDTGAEPLEPGFEQQLFDTQEEAEASLAATGYTYTESDESGARFYTAEGRNDVVLSQGVRGWQAMEMDADDGGANTEGDNTPSEADRIGEALQGILQETDSTAAMDALEKLMDEAEAAGMDIDNDPNMLAASDHVTKLLEQEAA